ncbi:HAD superfamily, subfamily IIIB (Acid phosphatase) [Marininema mesophilum]|uniref:HAD superfamily, subfamily IIIB (Acid phosphatase) n=1 Tax=Marininema mesophilum TaxID=1048340 RepID=A0A1H2ZJU2_9BACL|nr:HAD family acid phosphatase [Marininema mesophilum]SDX17666.1 HAD superfamily, subfamily IIIB (Acid phosphatase) [Marininema mesophilum]
MQRKWFQSVMLLVVTSFLWGLGAAHVTYAAPSTSSSSAPEFDFKESEFEAPPKTGFIHGYNQLLSTHTPHHNGYDLVVNKDDVQVIKGKFQYGDFRKDLEDEWVSIYTYSLSGKDSSWLKIGRAKTDLDGRINFEIPKESKLSSGVHLVKLLVEGDGTSAYMYVHNLAEKTKTVVFDIDGTLTTDDFENIKEYLNEFWNGEYKAKMYEDANRAVRYYADRGYTIVYLTARPYWLTEKSQAWLKELGFPRGIIHTYDGRDLLFGDKTAVYKKEYLQEIGSKGMSIDYAYGNATTDIDAYMGYGLPGNRTFIIGENAGKNGTTPISSYPEHLKGLP